MTHTAIVVREVRAANHAMDLLRLRQLSTRWAVGIVGILLLIEGLGFSLLRHTGFLIFAIMAVLLVSIAMRTCSGIIVDEREGGTLDLLFLAGVNSWELFLGKLLGALLIASSTILGSVPLLAFPFLCGGLSFETFAGMLAFLSALLLATVGLSLLVSTLAREISNAQTSLIVIGILVCFGLPIVHWMGRLVTGLPPFREGWLAISPFHTAMLLDSSLGSVSRIHFWRGTTLMALEGIGCMAAASLLLRHVWKRDLDSAHAVDRRAGTIGVRPPISDSRSPVEAVMESARRRLRIHWGATGLAFGLWLLGGFMWGRPWLSPVVALCVSFLMATVAEILLPMPLIDRITTLRRDGGLEALLITPLSSEAIVDGFVVGTSSLLHRWRRCLLVLISIILLAAVPMHRWNLGAAFTYLAISSVLLAWIASNPTARLYGSFRISVFTGDPRTAHLKQGTWITQIAAGQVWNGFNLFRTLRGLGRLPNFPSGSTAELIITLVALTIIVAVTVGSHGSYRTVRQLAIDELRTLASQPLPARKDPRLKKWTPNQPVPTE